MVNMNMNIPDGVHQKLKLAAVLQDRSMKEHIIALLEEHVQKSNELKRIMRKL